MIKTKKTTKALLCTLILGITPIAFAETDNNLSADVDDFLKDMINQSNTAPIKIPDVQPEFQKNVPQAETYESNIPVTHQKIIKKINIPAVFEEETYSEGLSSFETAKMNRKYKSTYLKNVPKNSVLVANKDFLIMPEREYLTFQNGVRVVEPSANEGGFFTTCYLKIVKTNDRVLIQQHDTKGLKITFSESTEQTLENGIILYGHRFTFAENSLVELAQCYTSEKVEPLTINDVLKETGNAFWIKIAPVVKAKLYD